MSVPVPRRPVDPVAEMAELRAMVDRWRRLTPADQLREIARRQGTSVEMAALAGRPCPPGPVRSR